jgi:cytoskeletal protein CcmA (bactofilin family)
MNFPRLSTALALVLVGALPAGAQHKIEKSDGRGVSVVRIGSTQAASGESLRLAVDEAWEGNTYFVGDTIDVDGKIAGDLVAAARNVELGGSVGHDLAVGAGEMFVSGDVGGDVRAAGARLVLGGSVGGELVFLGGELILEPSAEVRGPAIVWSSRVILDGVIEGPAQVGAGLVEVNGTVLGDVRINCDELVFGPLARIDGDLTFSARNRVEVPPGVVGGEQSELSRPLPEHTVIVTETIDEVGSALSALWLFFSFYLSIVSLLGGILLWMLFRPLVDGVMRRVSSGTSVGIAFGVGLVALLVMLVVGFACFFLGPLWLALWSAFGALIYFGSLVGKIVLGRFALLPLLRRSAHPLLALLVGVVLMFFIGLIPVFGTLAWMIVTIIGMGVLLLQIRGAEGRPEAIPLPEAEAGPV